LQNAVQSFFYRKIIFYLLVQAEHSNIFSLSMQKGLSFKPDAGTNFGQITHSLVVIITIDIF